MTLLWIAGWYPNQLEPYSGDFVQRHARAVSLYHKVHVILVVRDATGIPTNAVRTEEYTEGRLSEEKIYYSQHIPGPPMLDKLFSQLKYTSLLRKHIKTYINSHGKPDLIHFYIGMKTAAVAGWVSRQWKIPYVVSEQWTGFLTEGQPHFQDLQFFLRWKWKHMIKNAAGIHAVSSYLGSAIRQLVAQDMQIEVIPNVVDTTIFLPVAQEKQDLIRLVHVTGLAYQKNTEDILSAIAILKNRGVIVQLDIIGMYRLELEQLCIKLNIQGSVRLHGEMNQRGLAVYFQQADALVIYSRFETFGCVVIEAMACGTPVIASDIPVLHELLHDRRNGIFAEGENPEKLAGSLDRFIAERALFDKKNIASECADKYNYTKVGAEFSTWYNSILLH